MLDSEIVGIVDQISIQDGGDEDNCVPSPIDIINLPKNKEFAKILIREINVLKNHPFLNIQDTRNHLDDFELNIEMFLKDDTYLSLYNDLLDDLESKRTESYRILDKANSDYTLIKAIYSSLKEIWLSKFSKETSDKKREGEAEYILSFMRDEIVRREVLKKRVDSVVEDVSQKINSVKKKVEIFDISHRVIGIVSGNAGSEVKENFLKSLKEVKNESSEVKKGFNSGKKIGWNEIKS